MQRTRSTSFGISALAALLILVFAGCSGEGGSFATSTTTAPPTTAIPASTSTTGGLPTTTAGPAFVVGTPGLYPPDPLPGSGGANGSGCPPEAGPLPDGVWFGKVLQATPGGMRLDPGCFYFGDAAAAAAAEDGITDLPSPHYLRDPLPDSVDVPAADDAVVYSIDNSGDDLTFLALSLREWPAQSGGYTLCPGEGCAVWLYVNGGAITEILEQYLP